MGLPGPSCALWLWQALAAGPCLPQATKPEVSSHTCEMQLPASLVDLRVPGDCSAEVALQRLHTR